MTTLSIQKNKPIMIIHDAKMKVVIPLHSKLLVGGSAGVIGLCATFPIDIVKTQLQSQTKHSVLSPFSGPLQVAQRIMATEGPKGFYRGVIPTMIGAIPEKAVKLAVNEYLREWLTDTRGNLPIKMQMLAGAGAGFAQVIITNPTEVIKIRLQTQAKLPIHEQLTARKIIGQLGLRGLYQGVDACLLRDIPYAIIFFPLYAGIKEYYSERATGKNSLPSVMFAGGVAGATAAAICTPADVIKTRRQMRGAPYKGTIDCFRQIVATSGPSILLKGAVPRMMVQAPLFGITLMAFEVQKQYLEGK